VNFAALGAEVVQSFPAELAGNCTQKQENSVETAVIPAKRQNKLLKAAKSEASRFPALAALFCSKSGKKMLRYAEVKLRVASFPLCWRCK
jgi:hypothetical protein